MKFVVTLKTFNFDIVKPLNETWCIPLVTIASGLAAGGREVVVVVGDFGVGVGGVVVICVGTQRLDGPQQHGVRGVQRVVQHVQQRRQQRQRRRHRAGTPRAPRTTRAAPAPRRLRARAQDLTALPATTPLF